MVDKAKFVSEARAQGISDDKIADYLAKRTNSADFLTNARAGGAKDTALVDFLVNKADDSGMTDTPLPLQPNDTLGFVNGGSKVFNNILGAGSSALQHVGVPSDAVHAVGGAIRNPFAAFGGQPLLNKDQIANMNAEAAGIGQRPGKLGNAAGEIAATIPAAVASAGLAPEALAGNGIRVSSPLVARILSAASGKGFPGAAVQGVEQGLQTTDKTDLGGIATDAAYGGLGGTLGQVANHAVGAFVAPRFGHAMNQLLDIGQKKFSLAALSGIGGAKKVEDAFRSVPGLGGFVEGSQNAMQSDFNRAYLQKAADTADLAVPYIGKPTDQTYRDLKGAFKDRYNGIDSRVNMTLDKPLYNAGQGGVHQTIQDVLQSGQRHDLAREANALFNPQFDPATNTWTMGNLTGQSFQDIDGALRAEAKHLRNPGVGVSQSYASTEATRRIDVARQALKDAMGRQQPDLADKLARADKGYAMFKRAQEALTQPGQGVDPSSFSAKALYEKTMNAQGRNTRINAGSSGDVPGQELARAALQVMGTKLGDSGTSLRASISKMVGGGDAQGGLGAGAGILGAKTVGAGVVAAHPLAAGAGALLATGLYGGYAPGVRDAIANTLIGNSRNRILVAARKALDARALNNVSRLPLNAIGDSGTGITDQPKVRIVNGKKQILNSATGKYEDAQ